MDSAFVSDDAKRYFFFLDALAPELLLFLVIFRFIVTGVCFMDVQI